MSRGRFLAVKIFVVVAIMFAMTWANLQCRSRNKIAEAEKLLAEGRERLAYETYAEVLSMHYAPLSPYVRKAFDRIVGFGETRERAGDTSMAVWAYALATNSFPPLLYTPFRSERLALKARVEALRPKVDHLNQKFIPPLK